MDDQGEEVARLIGAQTEDTLRQALSALRGEPCPGLGPLPELEPGPHTVIEQDEPLIFPAQENPEEAFTCESGDPTFVGGEGAVQYDPALGPGAIEGCGGAGPEGFEGPVFE